MQDNVATAEQAEAAVPKLQEQVQELQGQLGQAEQVCSGPHCDSAAAAECIALWGQAVSCEHVARGGDARGVPRQG